MIFSNFTRNLQYGRVLKMMRILSRKIFLGSFLWAILVCAPSSSMEKQSTSHVLQESEKNNCVFETSRLIAYPADGVKIQGMADILNEQVDGHLNGKHYESGGFKDFDWVQKKRNLILGNLEKGVISGRFFYLKENPDKLVCFVGAELSYFTESSNIFNSIVPFWGISTDYQGKGMVSEALRGFVLADILRDQHFTSLYISIHPDNNASIHLAEGVLGATKVKEGMNYSNTQPRVFYEVSADCLRKKSESYPKIQWQ